MQEQENKFLNILQILTLFAGIVVNLLNLLYEINLVSFFVNPNVNKVAIVVILFLWILIITIIKDSFLNLHNLAKSFKNFFILLVILTLIFGIYITLPGFLKINWLIDFFQFFLYVIFWLVIFLLLSNSLLSSIRNASFREKKKYFSQTLLETIKRYGAIYTDKNLRIIGSYTIQPQDINELNILNNRNLFTIDSFLTDGEKFWWIKTDLDALQIYFTSEIKEQDFNNFIEHFKSKHPFLSKNSE
jgi:hypothetical protein